MKAAIFAGLALFLATAAFGGTDVFQKWRTPEGTLYIGDRPPEGSVLVDRVELTTSDEASAAPAPDVLADAARHGREIIRLRAAAREAERDRELERGLREPAPAPVERTVPSVWVIGGGSSGHHHGHGRPHRPRLGIGPSPISAFAKPDIRLVTPDFSASSMAPAFPAPSRRSPTGW